MGTSVCSLCRHRHTTNAMLDLAINAAGDASFEFPARLLFLLLKAAVVHCDSKWAELLNKELDRLDFMPENVLSDRDILFTSNAFTQLFQRLLGTEQRMSTKS